MTVLHYRKYFLVSNKIFKYINSRSCCSAEISWKGGSSKNTCMVMSNHRLLPLPKGPCPISIWMNLSFWLLWISVAFWVSWSRHTPNRQVWTSSRLDKLLGSNGKTKSSQAWILYSGLPQWRKYNICLLHKESSHEHPRNMSCERIH